MFISATCKKDESTLFKKSCIVMTMHIYFVWKKNVKNMKIIILGYE